MNKSHQLGQYGESLARQYLTQSDFQILETNWRWQKAEIDIIALQDQTIIFVEVKTRRSERFGQPSEFVSVKKQDLMKEAAEAFLEINAMENEIRFDIISIIANSPFPKIDHIPNAF